MYKIEGLEADLGNVKAINIALENRSKELGS